MNKHGLIEIEVVGLENAFKDVYHNDGTKRVLINPCMIAEVWPVETVKISNRSSDVAARREVAGTLDVARLYTLNSHDSKHLKFITPASYAKLYGMLDA